MIFLLMCLCFSFSCLTVANQLANVSSSTNNSLLSSRVQTQSGEYPSNHISQASNTFSLSSDYTSVAVYDSVSSMSATMTQPKPLPESIISKLIYVYCKHYFEDHATKPYETSTSDSTPSVSTLLYKKIRRKFVTKPQEKAISRPSQANSDSRSVAATLAEQLINTNQIAIFQQSSSKLSHELQDFSIQSSQKTHASRATTDTNRNHVQETLSIGQSLSVFTMVSNTTTASAVSLKKNMRVTKFSHRRKGSRWAKRKSKPSQSTAHTTTQRYSASRRETLVTGNSVSAHYDGKA